VNVDDDDIWQALGNSTRRQILDLLRDGPMITGDICNEFKTSRYAIMKHLNILVEVNLVLFEKRGRKRLNYLNPVPLQRALSRWLKPFDEIAVTRLNELKDVVEGSEDEND
jgi:predicted transcriptional regulator